MGVTQRDIARLANVSVTTVSNVLRGEGRASDDVRAKIVKLADELGYERSLLKNLEIIGLIVCGSPEGFSTEDAYLFSERASYYSIQAVEGIQSVLGENGYSLIYHVLKGFDDGGKVPDMVTQRLVKGILVIGGSISDEYLYRLKEHALPTVLLFTEVRNIELDSVLADNRQGAYNATKHLIDLGHRRIGFINGWEATHTSEMKLDGYANALKVAGIPMEDALCEQGDFSKKSGYIAMKSLLELNPRPTAVFVADDTMALGAVEACRKANLCIPEQMAIVGFGDSPLASAVYPAMSTVRVFKRKIGELSAKRLLEIMNEPNDENQRIIVSTQLVCRDSCGCKK